MGGAQQAQGHVQVLIDMIDLGANAQAASDAARFAHAQATNTVYLESDLYDLVGRQIKAHRTQGGFGERRRHGWLPGHFVHALLGARAFERAAVCGNARVFIRPGRGGAQSNAARRAALEAPIEGVYHGASDHRKDGQAVGW